MLIRVSQRQAIWGFGPLWLTAMDEEPKDIDLDKLDRTTKEAIKRGLQSKTLFEVDENGKRIRKNGESPPLQVPTVTESEDVLLTIDPVTKEKLRELLSNGITTIRREVALMTGAKMISSAIALERQGKDRKTVISLLEKQMNKAKDLSDPRLFKANNMYDNLVEEEDGETVKFKVEDIVFIHKEIEEEESEEK